MKRRNFLKIAGCSTAFGIVTLNAKKVSALTSEGYPDWDMIDKLSLPRRCLVVDKLWHQKMTTNGCLALYHIEKGKTPTRLENINGKIVPKDPENFKGDRILVPTYPIEGKTTKEIIDQENRDFISMLEYSIGLYAHRISCPTGIPIHRSSAIRLFEELEATNLCVGHLLCNKRTLKNFQNTVKLYRHEKRRMKDENTIWGADILVSDCVVNNKMYALASPEFLGVFVERGSKNKNPRKRETGMMLPHAHGAATIDFSIIG